MMRGMELQNDNDMDNVKGGEDGSYDDNVFDDDMTLVVIMIVMT